LAALAHGVVPDVRDDEVVAGRFWTSFISSPRSLMRTPVMVSPRKLDRRLENV
jgi:hypothetical protein